MTRIVVIGGGIAGTETALTLACGLPDAEIGLVGRWPALRLLPDLVYVPFGVSPARVDVPLGTALQQRGIDLVQHEARAVDVEACTVELSDGAQLAYDTLVLATGVEPLPDGGTQHLRTLDDARHLGEQLRALRERERSTLLVRVGIDNAWTPPAYEFALLAAAWRDANDVNVEIALATEEMEPFDMFGIDASSAVREQLEQAGIDTLVRVPADRLDELDADVTVNFDALRARKVPGVPGIGSTGFFEADEHGQIAPDVFVAGDASNIAYKAAFATSWQARRILVALGGDPSRLGSEVDGIPVGECEYQMDLVTKTLHVRFDEQSHLSEAFLGLRPRVFHSESPPDKLAGTLVREQLLGDDYERQVGRRFRELMRSGS